MGRMAFESVRSFIENLIGSKGRESDCGCTNCNSICTELTTYKPSLRTQIGDLDKLFTMMLITAQPDYPLTNPGENLAIDFACVYDVACMLMCYADLGAGESLYVAYELQRWSEDAPEYIRWGGKSTAFKNMFNIIEAKLSNLIDTFDFEEEGTATDDFDFKVSSSDYQSIATICLNYQAGDLQDLLTAEQYAELLSSIELHRSMGEI